MIDIKELEMVTMSINGKKKISVKVNPDSIIMSDHPTKSADEFVNPVVCPRCADEVYSLGISLHDYIGDLYLKLAEINKGENNPYTNLILNQLAAKKEIENIAKYNLNKLLAYFYNNGGPIIESPVSEQSATEIQPSINRIVASFLNRVDFILSRASNGDISARDLDNEINNDISFMLNAMGKLFQNNAMQNAFSELISVRYIQQKP